MGVAVTSRRRSLPPERETCSLTPATPCSRTSAGGSSVPTSRVAAGLRSTRRPPASTTTTPSLIESTIVPISRAWSRAARSEATSASVSSVVSRRETARTSGTRTTTRTNAWRTSARA